LEEEYFYMKKITFCFVAIALSMTQTAFAQSNQAAAALANQSGCMTCHKAEGKLVGPGFQEIAEKYKNQPEALDTLMQKVKKGGSGVWGRIPMPAHPQLSDESLNTLVSWILRGAPTQ
jgi:cytochrome c